MNPYSSHYSQRMPKSSSSSYNGRSFYGPGGDNAEAHSPNSQATPRDIRKDLLALGIDIDESLIDRMSRNLGISTTFNSVAKASTIVRERTKIDDNLDISYRNVTEGQEDTAPKTPTKFAHSQFQVGDFAGNILLKS
jgi:hypothetical protein